MRGGCSMDSDIDKVIFTAIDPRGRSTMLAYFRDGSWAVVIDGQRQQPNWARTDLAAAARAYTKLICQQAE